METVGTRTTVKRQFCIAGFKICSTLNGANVFMGSILFFFSSLQSMDAFMKPPESEVFFLVKLLIMKLISCSLDGLFLLGWVLINYMI